MDGTDIFGHGMRQATVVMKQVRPDHQANSTPSNEWNVRDLAQHMLTELRSVPSVLEGTVSDELDQDDEDSEPLAATEDVNDLVMNWQKASDRADEVVADCDPDESVQFANRSVSIDEYLWQMGCDLLIHAWDLAEGIGMQLKLAPSVVKEVYEAAGKHRLAFLNDSFGAPVEVSTQADTQTKLLGLFGRRSGWRTAT